MPRYTRIYGDFVSRLDEVSILRKSAAELERSSRPLLLGPEISALCRASVVLLSSHIEAYIKELGEHTLDAAHSQAVPRVNIAPQFFYYVSRERIEKIRAASQPDAISRHVQSLFDNDTLYWKQTETLHGPIQSDSFNKGFANPKFEKVRAYFGRFGYTDFRRDFTRSLGRDARVIENGLNAIVDARNLIAHGDTTATKTPAELKEMEQVAKTFCRVVDGIFAEWCKRSFCKIR